MKTEIYLVVTIDTECDKDLDWRISRPMAFSSVTDGIPALLTPLFERHNITPTYLLSPEVIQNELCIKALQTIETCELGTHLHGEFVAPNADWNASRTSTPQLLYSTEIELKKLVNLTNLFKDTFGKRPTSFRAGRFGLSDQTLSFLSELGYLVDTSVTPFWTHTFEGRAVRNYWGSPLQPYRPALSDLRMKGNLGVLEVPVTIINRQLAKWPRWLLRSMDRQTSWYKRLFRILKRPTPTTVWLRPQRSSTEEMIQAAKNIIRLSKSRRPVLNLMYHSVEVIPGASPYAQTDKEVQVIIESQDELFTYLNKHYSLRSVGLSELYALT